MSIGSGNGADVDAQASAWAVRSSERQLTEAEQQELDEWLSASSRHVGAYVRAQALWIDVDRVAALDENAKADRQLYPRHWRRYLAAASALALGAPQIAFAKDPYASSPIRKISDAQWKQRLSPAARCPRP